MSDAELRGLERAFAASPRVATEDALLTARWRLEGAPDIPPRSMAKDADYDQCSRCLLMHYHVGGRSAWALGNSLGWSPEAAILNNARFVQEARVHSTAYTRAGDWTRQAWSYHCSLQPLARLKPIPADRYVRGSLDHDYAILTHIAEHGIYDPITITQGFQIVNGMRRYVAASKLHMVLVPTELRVVASAHELEQQQLMLNMHRGPVERRP